MIVVLQIRFWILKSTLFFSCYFKKHAQAIRDQNKSTSVPLACSQENCVCSYQAKKWAQRADWFKTNLYMDHLGVHSYLKMLSFLKSLLIIEFSKKKKVKLHDSAHFKNLCMCDVTLGFISYPRWVCFAINQQRNWVAPNTLLQCSIQNNALATRLSYRNNGTLQNLTPNLQFRYLTAQLYMFHTSAVHVLWMQQWFFYAGSTK